MRRCSRGLVVALTIATTLAALTGCGREAYHSPQAPEVSVPAPSTSESDATDSDATDSDATDSVATGRVAADGIFVGPDRPQECPPAAPNPLPPSAQVTAAIRCGFVVQRVAGDGEWRIVVHQRATGPAVDRLLTALALPSEPPSDGACAAVWIGPKDVDLETATGTVTVAPPVDGCHQPRVELRNAYTDLPWVTVTTTKLQQLRSEAAVAGQCAMWKDMIVVEGAGAQPASGVTVAVKDHPVRVCRYTSNGMDGTPLGGRQLTADEARHLATLLAAAPAAARCTQPHTRFAVVTVEAGPAIYVELDGCRRILDDDHTLSQASDELVALLAS